MNYFKNLIKSLLGKSVQSGSSVVDHLGLSTRANLHRILYLNNLFDLIDDVDGNVVECGVGQGRGLANLTALIQLKDSKRMLWGFDSFEGFPSLSIEDEASGEFEAGLIQYKQFDIPYVRQTLTYFGLSSVEIDSHISMVKGFIPDSLKNYDGNPIALLYIDLDIYEGYRDTLNSLWDMVSPGGVVAFDEYYKPLDTHKWPGAAKAINEFLESKNLRSSLQRDSLTGNAYIVKADV